MAMDGGAILILCLCGIAFVIGYAFGVTRPE